MRMTGGSPVVARGGASPACVRRKSSATAVARPSPPPWRSDMARSAFGLRKAEGRVKETGSIYLLASSGPGSATGDDHRRVEGALALARARVGGAWHGRSRSRRRDHDLVAFGQAL